MFVKCVQYSAFRIARREVCKVAATDEHVRLSSDRLTFCLCPHRDNGKSSLVMDTGRLGRIPIGRMPRLVLSGPPLKPPPNSGDPHFRRTPFRIAIARKIR